MTSNTIQVTAPSGSLKSLRHSVVAIVAATALLFHGCTAPTESPAVSSAETHEDGGIAQADSRVGDPNDWCKGHGLPESKCTICNPELKAGFQESGDWCGAHGLPESVCPKCNPMTRPPNVAAPSQVLPGTTIRFAAPRLEDDVGIEVQPASRTDLALTLETTAQIDFNLNRMAEVRTAVAGVIRNVAVELGQNVAEGDPLFELESAEVSTQQAQRGAAAERVSAARAQRDRQEELRGSEISSQRQLEVANQELQDAQSALRSLDQSLRFAGAKGSRRGGRFVVAAPISGTVIRRAGAHGSYATEADALITIADTSTMWALLAIPEWDAASVRVGQAVRVTVDGVVGQSFDGELTWISSEVDPRTRAVAARVELENPDGVLRAGQFARASVNVAEHDHAVSVPISALQRLGDESVVFIRTDAGVYEARVVEPGRSDGRVVQVHGSLREGELVVTTGAFLLRTELSPDSIGAGCADH